MVNANHTTELRGDVEAAIRDVREHVVSQVFETPDGGAVIFHGDGMSAHRVAPLNPTLPGFVTQAETVVEPASFIEYVTAYKSPNAICRASLGQTQIVCVLDYHGRARDGAGEGGDFAKPGRAAHTITLRCPFDPDYAKWRGIFGKQLPQKKLAEFIEDLIHTIGHPPAADLLEAITDMKIDRSVKFKSARNLTNGTIQFTYEEVDAERPKDGTVTLPEHIEIVVPIFQGANPQKLTARIRYQMEKGELALIVAVPGIEKAEREAFRAIGESVRAGTATPVFYTA